MIYLYQKQLCLCVQSLCVVSGYLIRGSVFHPSPFLLPFSTIPSLPPPPSLRTCLTLCLVCMHLQGIFPSLRMRFEMIMSTPTQVCSHEVRSRGYVCCSIFYITVHVVHEGVRNKSTISIFSKKCMPFALLWHFIKIV